MTTLDTKDLRLEGLQKIVEEYYNKLFEIKFEQMINKDKESKVNYLENYKKLFFEADRVIVEYKKTNNIKLILKDK